jgi:hypothetical protein
MISLLVVLIVSPTLKYPHAGLDPKPRFRWPLFEFSAFAAHAVLEVTQNDFIAF